ncbi:MAG: AI-2E family transporter [Planctomycetaceae bacterium]|nr:AI-2E family transporter [Planctomycetaceae bacterium]
MEAEKPAKSKREKTPRSIAFHVVLAATLYAVIQAYSLLSTILLSFLLIVLITLAVNPIVSRLRTWTGGRKRATGLILLGILTLGTLAVWAAVVPLKQSFATLSEKLPAYWERLQKPLIKMEQQAVISEEKLQEEVSAEIARETPETTHPQTTAEPVRPEPSQTVEVPGKPEKDEGSLRSSLIGMIQGVFGQIKGVALNTTQMLVVLVTVFFGVTFALMNPRPIFGALFSLVPERHHVKTLAILQRIAKFVPRWAVSVLISMLTIGSLFFLLMWPIFGFSDAILLGLIACLLSAIPFLGPLLSLIPALLLAIGEGGMTPMWVLLAYGAVQALEGNVILPLVMSQGMKLHPLAVIFSVLLSVAAFGVLGVLIAAPLVAIVGIFHEELYRKRFLPTITDEDLDRLARDALLEDRKGKS